MEMDCKVSFLIVALIFACVKCDEPGAVDTDFFDTADQLTALNDVGDQEIHFNRQDDDDFDTKTPKLDRQKRGAGNGRGLCYDESLNGSDYNGNKWMSRTRKPCLRWVDALHCNHFPFKGLALLDLKLAGNKCRNPGQQLSSPWCYTSITDQKCEVAFCEVCNVDRQSDLHSDCQERIEADSNFCIVDRERLGCAASCNIFAFPPPPNSKDCPDGWNEYKDRCWKWFSGAKTQTEAEYHCNSLGGTIFRLRNQDDTNMIMDFQLNSSDNETKSNIWANGRYMPHRSQFLTLGDLQPLLFRDLVCSSEEYNSSNGNLYIRSYGQRKAGKLDTASDTTKMNTICEIPRIVTYGPPPMPAHSVPKTPYGSEYTPGDRVTFICKRQGFEDNEITIECGLTGWPKLESACKPCKKYWKHYKDRCWAWSRIGKTQQKSQEFCVSHNSTMFQIHDQNDLDEIREFKQSKAHPKVGWNLWLNARRSDDGHFYTLDGQSQVDFLPWAQNVDFSNATNSGIYLLGEDEEEAGKYQMQNQRVSYNFMCETQAEGSECRDVSEQRCRDLLSIVPNMCTSPDRAEMARLCHRTCGKCSENKRQPVILDFCPPGWINKRNRCYKLFDSLMRQLEAEEHCTEFGATTLKIKTLADYNAFRDLIQDFEEDSFRVWLNARRGEDSVYRTLDDETPVHFMTRLFRKIDDINKTKAGFILVQSVRQDKVRPSATYDRMKMHTICQLTLRGDTC